MLLITKRFAEAIAANHTEYNIYGDATCVHCFESVADHEDDCVVIAAKLLLEKEWGIKNA